VSVVVDGGAAGVHAHFAGGLRDKGFGFSGEGVVEEDFGHRRSVVSLGDWRNTGLYLSGSRGSNARLNVGRSRPGVRDVEVAFER
jgi:hypothetical protein